MGIGHDLLVKLVRARWFAIAAGATTTTGHGCRAEGDQADEQGQAGHRPREKESKAATCCRRGETLLGGHCKQLIIVIHLSRRQVADGHR